jgi:hypothetical protein
VDHDAAPEEASASAGLDALAAQNRVSKRKLNAIERATRILFIAPFLHNRTARENPLSLSYNHIPLKDSKR